MLINDGMFCILFRSCLVAVISSRSAHSLKSHAPSRLLEEAFHPAPHLHYYSAKHPKSPCQQHYIRHWLMLLNTTNQMHAVWSWSLSVTCVLPFLSFPERFVSDFLWVSYVARSTEYKHSVHLPYRAQTFFLLDRHKENVYCWNFFCAFGNILDVLRDHN